MTSSIVAKLNAVRMKNTEQIQQYTNNQSQDETNYNNTLINNCKN